MKACHRRFVRRRLGVQIQRPLTSSTDSRSRRPAVPTANCESSSILSKSCSTAAGSATGSRHSCCEKDGCQTCGMMNEKSRATMLTAKSSGCTEKRSYSARYAQTLPRTLLGMPLWTSPRIFLLLRIWVGLIEESAAIHLASRARYSSRKPFPLPSADSSVGGEKCDSEVVDRASEGSGVRKRGEAGTGAARVAAPGRKGVAGSDSVVARLGRDCTGLGEGAKSLPCKRISASGLMISNSLLPIWMVSSSKSRFEIPVV